MKHQPNLDRFFLPISKAVIIIPIAVVIIALFFKAYDRLLPYRQTSQTPAPEISQAAPAPLVSSKPKLSLDLNGPYRCEGVSTGQTAKLYIKNKQISSEIVKNGVSEHILLNGDCLYKWAGYKGEKTCGVSQLISLYDMMSAYGGSSGISFDTLAEAATSAGYASASDAAIMREVVQSCKKEEVVDTVFAVPTNINFKVNNSLNNLLQQGQ